MTCSKPHPTNYEYFCEYRDIITLTSIINLVDKEIIGKDEIEQAQSVYNEETEQTYELPDMPTQERNALRAEQRAKLKGVSNER